MAVTEQPVDQLQLPNQPGDDAQQPAAAKRSNALQRMLGGWHTYIRQPVLPAAFALALLYLTVMSLGAQRVCLHLTFVYVCCSLAVHNARFGACTDWALTTAH